MENCEIIDIRPVRVLAEYEDGGGPASVIQRADIEVASGWQADTGVFSNKFEFRIVLGADSGQDVARFEFDLVVDYRTAEGFTPDRDAAEFVTSTTGYFAAYPYARELLQNASARLRLDPVVLGLLRRRPDGGLETMSIGALQRPKRVG